MKRTKILRILSAVFLLASCGEHEHTYSSTWEYDENQHWNPATCEHTDTKGNKANHIFGSVNTVDGKNMVTCTACGYTYENPNYVEESDSFSGITEFDNDVDIHTERQREYLAYEGDYSKLTVSEYPDGQQTISDPLMHTITWDFGDHTDETIYSVTIGQKKDLSDGFEIPGTNEKSLDIYNLFLGTNYYRVNATTGDTKVGSEVYELTVDSTMPRNLYVGTRMTNCRDMGGRVLPDGGTIRQGLLYRTCGSGYDYGSKMTQEGEDILTKQLKVKTEINLNNTTSYNANLDGVKIYDTFMDYNEGQVNTSRHHFSRNTENVRNVFEILSKRESYPVFYHCRIGTDRTGLIAILLNAVLGVPLNEIYQDYLFSNFGKIGTQRKIGAGDDDDITVYLREIMAMPGETLQEKTYNTLLTIGVTKEMIASIMDILIEGDKPTNDNGQIVVTAKDMVLEGTTLETKDKTSLVERSAPEYSTKLTSDASATATFTSDSGTKSLYVYIGHMDSVTTKKVNESISATVDGETITIPEINFKEAGLGKCNSRMNYYFVKLGTADMSAGEHTITITGVNNDIVLGNVAIF